MIRDVKIGPSPTWIQERLISAGQRPISNIVDITNYVMLELGQPLHAFDYDTIARHHIIVRRAAPGEKFTTLDNIPRELSGDMLVIADESGAVALAGVIGGLDSEVTDGTTNILLEAANFLGPNVRRTSSGAEDPQRGLDALRKRPVARTARRSPQSARRSCSSRCAAAPRSRARLIPIPGSSKEVRVEVTRERIVQVLGIDPSTEKVTSALTGLGFDVALEATADRTPCTVPYWRTDVRIDDDICEEIARVIGYDQIPALPLAAAIPQRVVQPLRELRERTRDILAAAGMRETISYAMTTMEALSRVVPKETLAIYPPMKLVNPISSEHEFLRPTLRASLLHDPGSESALPEG